VRVTRNFRGVSDAGKVLQRNPCAFRRFHGDKSVSPLRFNGNPVYFLGSACSHLRFLCPFRLGQPPRRAAPPLAGTRHLRVQKRHDGVTLRSPSGQNLPLASAIPALRALPLATEPAKARQPQSRKAQANEGDCARLGSSRPVVIQYDVVDVGLGAIVKRNL